MEILLANRVMSFRGRRRTPRHEPHKTYVVAILEVQEINQPGHACRGSQPNHRPSVNSRDSSRPKAFLAEAAYQIAMRRAGRRRPHQPLASRRGHRHRIVAGFRHRDAFCDGLNALTGLRRPRSGGAFHACANIRATGMHSRELADALLSAAGVAAARLTRN